MDWKKWPLYALHCLDRSWQTPNHSRSYCSKRRSPGIQPLAQFRNSWGRFPPRRPHRWKDLDLSFKTWGPGCKIAKFDCMTGKIWTTRDRLVISPEWGTCLPEIPTDDATIDHTERRHDVTFISVDVESQENRCTIFYKKTLSILWHFNRKNWWDIDNFALMHNIL
jgi:hypothetical protein